MALGRAAAGAVQLPGAAVGVLSPAGTGFAVTGLLPAADEQSPMNRRVELNSARYSSTRVS